MTLLIFSKDRGPRFAAEISKLAPDLEIRLWPDMGRIEDIRYVLAWLPQPGVMKTLPSLELIVSVGAGVDGLLLDAELPNVPLVRYIDPDLAGRMACYVGSQVLHHQRRLSEYAEFQRNRQWKEVPEPAANEVRVGLMGLGEMGQACIRVLSPFGFQLRGWSRQQRRIDGVKCFVGTAGLDEFLAETDILACVLPLTPDTRGILNRDLIRKLSRTGRHERMPGAVLINAGRGGLQVSPDIAAALDAGELYAASLDVFETEPLPADSPFWGNPRVVITPHNAAESSPRAIARNCVRQIGLLRAGKPLENMIDRVRGY